MDGMTFKILDVLTREVGNPVSISQLVRRINELHGSTFYADTYRKLSMLVKEGYIRSEKAGNTSLATLNFRNYLLIDLLTEMELRRKLDLLAERPELQMLFADIEMYSRDLRIINSISAIDSARNMRLNRQEFLVLLQMSSKGAARIKIDSINAMMSALQRKHNIRIDHLILGKDEFLHLLASEERNQLREMLANAITFLSPQSFWTEIKMALEKGIRIELEGKETNPAKISESDLMFNLARFGYKEIGAEIKQGQAICIEYIATSILIQNEGRRVEAIPIILARNKANYNLLLFLSQKYRVSDRLLGLLKALNKIRPMKEVGEAIRTLETMNVKEIKANERSIMEKMRLYGVAE